MLKSAVEMLPQYITDRDDNSDETLAQEEINQIWCQWAGSILDIPFASILDVELQVLDLEDFNEVQHALIKGWRSILMHWALGKRKFELSHDNYLESAKYYFENSRTASATIIRTSRLLTRASMDLGNTSPDTLFLVASFAWPLRNSDPAFSKLCWNYLVNAPWQTDSATLCILFEDAHELGSLNNHPWLNNRRTLLDLAEQQFTAGQPIGARETLEAVAICQTKGWGNWSKEHIDDIESPDDFKSEEVLDGAFGCLKRLATYYIDNAQVSIHARAVSQFVERLFMRSSEDNARQLDGPDDSPERLRIYLSETVWDRPFAEASEVVNGMKTPRALEMEIARAMEVDQIHHARRLAEAAIVREYGGFFSNGSHKAIGGAFDKFVKTPSQTLYQDHFVRTAVNHLAPIYVETDFIHQRALDLTLKISDKPFFIGTEAPLEPIKKDLDRFVNNADIFKLLKKSNRDLEVMGGLNDDEKEARDYLLEWFEGRFASAAQSGLFDTFVSAVSATPNEAKQFNQSLPLVEQTMGAALELMFRSGHQLVGNDNDLRAQGRRIREENGVGKTLMDRSFEETRTNTFGATAVSAAMGLLPPGLPAFVGGTVDLGTTMLLCFRGIAQVAALFGKPRLTSAEGFAFVLDSFALGCSSSGGEGLMGYLDMRERGQLTPITVGAVDYGTKRLQKHIWTRSSGKPRQVAQQAIDQIARLCGLSLSKNVQRSVVPVVGAVYCGFTTYEFINDIIHAATVVATRDGLDGKMEGNHAKLQ